MSQIFTNQQVQDFADNLAVLVVDMVEKANAGHPGAPMGMALPLSELFLNHLNFNPFEPTWINRDRFVLSAGHASAGLYALLHLLKYEEMTMEQLQLFRQWGGKTAGHPEYEPELGIEMTTGPLGQGISTAVGIALGAHLQNQRYPQVIDHQVFVMASEGDIMEGVSYEASSIAGHLGLSRLNVLLDRNHITIDGKAELSFDEDIRQRFEAQGWAVQEVDGTDIEQIRASLEQVKAEDKRPSLIICETHIGWRSSKEDSSGAHGSPLGAEVAAEFKKQLGYDEKQSFVVRDDISAIGEQAAKQGKKTFKAWQEKQQAKDLMNVEKLYQGNMTESIDWEALRWNQGKSMATRKASGKVLDAILPQIPHLIGGSADLTPSNNTLAAKIEDIQQDKFGGRYIRFGIREHAMGAILNGLALQGGIIPYGGTFLVFSDYMRPALRLAALMGVKSIFVFTHDSIGLGEDGPTHQPVEHLTSLRAIPNLNVVRPADANETALSWRWILEQEGPSCIVLTRQNVEVTTQASYEQFSRGGYVVHENEAAQITLLATGSEVSLAMQSVTALKEEGIEARVVSLPMWKTFLSQDMEYLSEVTGIVPVLGIEAGSPHGWYSIVDDIIGVEEFGASAPGGKVMEEYGFTVGKVVERALEMIGES